MIMRYFLPMFGVLLLALGVAHVVQGTNVWSQDHPPVEPPSNPYRHAVAGSGIIEPETQNISVGSPVPGVVDEVFVEVGRNAAQGEPLFRLDERALKAELKSREADLARAVADVQRLESGPRPELVPINVAMVSEAEARLAGEQFKWDRMQELYRDDHANKDEYEIQRHAVDAAKAQVERAKAELLLLRAGSWGRDIEIARASADQARARVEQTRTELDRLTVKAPVNGEVLQVNVRPGEFVGTPPGQALVVLGNIEELHVRVDIDEHDIARFSGGSPATASLRGSPEEPLSLSFVRVEPFVIPKRSLSGIITERVDTRVLQVIYRIETKGRRLFVGQQLDVFIEAERPHVPPQNPAPGHSPAAPAPSQG